MGAESVRAKTLCLALVGLGAAGFVACLISAYVGMRDVMRTSGGFCANGGPYVIAHQCSSGDTKLLIIGIFGMLVSAGVLALATAWLDGPATGVGLLMWAGLFGALGWNFIDLSIHPPKGQSGTGGWVASGAVFELMALGGLIPVLMMAVGWLRSGAGRADAAPPLVHTAVPATGPTNWRTP